MVIPASDIIRDAGYFNVFSMDGYKGMAPPIPVPYSRKYFYKISLIKGNNTIYYADKTISVEKNMLLFANPFIPYNWTPEAKNVAGAFCVFTSDFFEDYKNIDDYPLYQPGSTSVLDITDEEADQVMTTFDKMFAEITSEYEYKHDVLRNLTLELIHLAMKWRPAQTLATAQSDSNAAKRLTSLFLELLDRQFPIESPMQTIHLKSPSEYAEKLHVHTNHLNRVLKETTGKTTSQLIAQKITSQSRLLLKHTSWNVSEIGWAMGFEDVSNFSKFFKQHAHATPTGFRS